MAIQREVSQPPTAPASGEAYDPAATTQQSSEAVLPASENTRTDALLKEEGVGVGRLEKAENVVASASTTSAVPVAIETENRDLNDLDDGAKPAATSSLDNKQSIRLVNHMGLRHSIPWAQCKEWKGMEKLIKTLYEDNKKAKKRIDNGDYDVFKGKEKILREHWDALIEPGCTIRIRFDSHQRQFDVDHFGLEIDTASETDQDDLDNTDGSESVYERDVNYKVDYFIKSQYGHDPPRFLFSTTHDTPIIPETTKQKAKPKGQFVLEETKTVNFKHRKVAQTKEEVQDHGLKLSIGDTISRKKLHVGSNALLNVLRAVAKYSSSPLSGENGDFFSDGTFWYPFTDLVHHRKELSDYKKENGGSRANHTPEYNAQCDRHIDLLIQYLENDPGLELKSLESKWAKKVPTTTFATLWLLMKPGTDVYVREDGQLNAYVVDQLNGGPNDEFRSKWPFEPRSYIIRVWNLIYDGQVIKRMSKILKVSIFDGERDVMSLPLFPTFFQDKLDSGARRKQLMDRGKKFFQYAKGSQFLEYTGLGLKPDQKKYRRARVVVEHESKPWNNTEFSSVPEWNLTIAFPMGPGVVNLQQLPHGDRLCGKIECRQCKDLRGPVIERARAPRCECADCEDLEGVKKEYITTTFSGYDYINPRETKELSEHQYLLCMSHMFGFVLKDRTYDILDIDGLHEPKFASNAIDQLVMRPEKNKDTIKAIVETYADSDSQTELFSVDFIRGKGEGQIFLLHGPPGTGKTLTAESVAEYTKRPLLSITAADLGHEPVELEKNLLRFFKNATNWDAIVLLDEADVYLERRSSNDLKRNSVVSIFLRALEYFQGILFLTTNRVGHFDEAFMSRIHVSIGYDPLDDKAREQIWDALFRKLKDDYKSGGPEFKYEWEAKRYVQKSDDVKELQLNGREIRNAFQTAVALALFDSRKARERGAPVEDSIPEVTEAHLSQVVSMSAAFKRYIKATHEGIDDADHAFKLGNRYDRWTTEGPY